MSTSHIKTPFDAGFSGSVDIVSEGNAGTEVVTHFPAELLLDWSMALDTENILKAHILIVDDIESNIDLLKKVLTSAGYVNITGITDPGQFAR